MRSALRSLARGAFRPLLHAANRVVSPIESRPGRAIAPLPHPPIFVVGPPRSGTTLLYQLLVESFDVGFLSNLHGWFWGAPSWVEALLRPRRWRRPSDFRSDLGSTAGPLAPSECAAFWHRFLPAKPDVLDPRVISARSRARMHAAVARFVRRCERAVVFKTVQNDGRLGILAEALPEAIFIVVRRDPFDNARSLLEARKRAHGSEDGWWSFEVPGLDTLSSEEPSVQVREQVLRTKRLIEGALRFLPRERVLEVDYEALCDRPHAVLDEIATWLAPRGVRRREATAIPESFPRRSSVAKGRHVSRDVPAEGTEAV